jgi:hypothetical protein
VDNLRRYLLVRVVVILRFVDNYGRLWITWCALGVDVWGGVHKHTKYRNLHIFYLVKRLRVEKYIYCQSHPNICFRSHKVWGGGGYPGAIP